MSFSLWREPEFVCRSFLVTALHARGLRGSTRHHWASSIYILELCPGKSVSVQPKRTAPSVAWLWCLLALFWNCMGNSPIWLPVCYIWPRAWDSWIMHCWDYYHTSPVVRRQQRSRLYSERPREKEKKNKRNQLGTNSFPVVDMFSTNCHMENILEMEKLDNHENVFTLDVNGSLI